MKKRIIKLVFLVFITLTMACGGNDNKESNAKIVSTKEVKKTDLNNWNVSFLLDLSDRINPEKYPNESLDYYKRDVGYINSVAQIFSSHLGQKRNRSMNDKIQLYFDPEPLNSEINSISKKLKFSVNKDNITLDLLDEIKNTYSTLPIEIYNLAINDGHYVGSDTWKFFKNKIKDYCVDPNYRNILIILTDGYIYHESSKIKEGNLSTYITPETIRKAKLTNSDWRTKIEEGQFGFIPVDQDLSNLEILVIGINPDVKNPYEEDVIKAYWTTWVEKMNVKKFEIKNADLPSNMEKVIKMFLSNQ